MKIQKEIECLTGMYFCSILHCRLLWEGFVFSLSSLNSGLYVYIYTHIYIHTGTQCLAFGNPLRQRTASKQNQLAHINSKRPTVHQNEMTESAQCTINFRTSLT